MERISLSQVRQNLFGLIKTKAYAEGTFKLASGKISDFYIDCRKITLSSEGAYWAGMLILDMIKDKGVAAIGGPTIGADPLVGAVTVLSLLDENKPLKGFLVRKEAKTHGLKRQIEGPQLEKGDRVVVIDDVATTGGSIVDAVMCLQKEDVTVEMVIVIVDRNEGAKEVVEKLGCPFFSLFNIIEFKSKK